MQNSYIMYRLGISVVLGSAEHHCSTSGADLNLNKKIQSCALPTKEVLKSDSSKFLRFVI